MTTKYELRGNDVIKITTTEEKLDLNNLSKKEMWEVIKELVKKSNQTNLTFPHTFVWTNNRDWRAVLTAN